MSSPAWLTAQPVAHRGLHDGLSGGPLVENTLAAADAAARAGYAIECDIQLSADGEVVVFHDDFLERLTAGTGFVHDKTLAELRKVSFRRATGPIPTLTEFLDCVAGRVPLFIELKSRWDGSTQLAEATAAMLARYSGHAAVMSFDPWPIRALRINAPQIVRGIVAERHYNDPDWAGLKPRQKFALGNLTHIAQSQPQFIAYYVKDLPALAPLFARYVLGIPLLTWTVRTEADRSSARRWANQMIFEGFRP
jgi:glycerophosphoryl diester phosphodiesterase